MIDVILHALHSALHALQSITNMYIYKIVQRFNVVKLCITISRAVLVRPILVFFEDNFILATVIYSSIIYRII